MPSPEEIFDFKFPVAEVVLANPPSAFTEGELHVIADVLTNPIVKRYLETLLWNQIRDAASMPVVEIGKPETNYKLAYVKGCIGILLTLGSIEKPQPKGKRQVKGKGQ